MRVTKKGEGEEGSVDYVNDMDGNKCDFKSILVSVTLNSVQHNRVI